MIDFIVNARAWLQQRKTFILLAIAALVTVKAFMDGHLNVQELLALLVVDGAAVTAKVGAVRTENAAREARDQAAEALHTIRQNLNGGGPWPR